MRSQTGIGRVKKQKEKEKKVKSRGRNKGIVEKTGSGLVRDVLSVCQFVRQLVNQSAPGQYLTYLTTVKSGKGRWGEERKGRRGGV